MMRKAIATSLLAFSLLAAGTAPALAAPPCKDAKGKFIKCPPAKPATPASAMAAKPAPAKVAPAKPATGKKAPCRDAKGRFAKCK